MMLSLFLFCQCFDFLYGKDPTLGLEELVKPPSKEIPFSNTVMGLPTFVFIGEELSRPLELLYVPPQESAAYSLVFASDSFVSPALIFSISSSFLFFTNIVFLLVVAELVEASPRTGNVASCLLLA